MNKAQLFVWLVLIVAFASFVVAHDEGLPHPHDELGNTVETSLARDWFFFGFGLFCGVIATWAILKDRYDTKHLNQKTIKKGK